MAATADGSATGGLRGADRGCRANFYRASRNTLRTSYQQSAISRPTEG